MGGMGPESVSLSSTRMTCECRGVAEKLVPADVHAEPEPQLRRHMRGVRAGSGQMREESKSAADLPVMPLH